jgi:Kef-type K+ transport system membrane component KefB
VALVGALALVLSAVPWLARSGTVQRIIREGQDATGQTTLRWAVVLLFLLLAIAGRFGLDVVLGALLAGIVLRAWTRRIDMTRSVSSASSTRLATGSSSRSSSSPPA